MDTLRHVLEQARELLKLIWRGCHMKAADAE